MPVTFFFPVYFPSRQEKGGDDWRIGMRDEMTLYGGRCCEVIQG